MATKLITFTLTVLLLVGSAFGGYTLYQRHLSSDVRAAVLASLGDNVSQADVAVFLRTAKLEIRTKRDVYIVDLLDKTTTHTHDANQYENEATNALLDPTLTANPPECGIALYDFSLRYHGWKSQCETALMSQTARTLRAEDTMHKDFAVANTERDEALRLLNVLRIEMGLPAFCKGLVRDNKEELAEAAKRAGCVLP